MPKALTLHLGHGKTGSSYIQSILSSNVELMSEQGITYPVHPSFVRAREGLVTSGNGELLESDNLTFAEHGMTLLSNENLFHNLARDENLQKLVLDKVDDLKVIIYTRDVMEFLISGCGQATKSGGNIKCLEDYLIQRHDPHHSRVLWWLDASRRFKFDISVLNYSKRKDSLIESFFNLVSPGIDLRALSTDRRVVNRSLTPAELSVLQVINFSDPELSRHLGGRLVDQIKYVKPVKSQISDQTFQIIEKRYSPLIQEINEYLAADDYLEFGLAEEFVSTTSYDPGLNFDQVQIISETLNDQRNHVRHNNAHEININLLEKIVDTLRDHALAIEAGKSLKIEDALELMKVAKYLRPEGVTINEKIIEWSQVITKS